ncbi:MAG: hypothetical protein QOJ49_1560 [Actinomycetota bacterium]|jgi:hypothetical protein|nr:hypothetical protein [Actinomycetota bacterium]
MLPLTVPVDLGRVEARRAASEELAKQIYRQAQPSLTERFLSWLYDRITGIADSFASVSPGGYVGLLVILTLLVVAVVAIRLKVGPFGRSARVERAFVLGGVRSAPEHRAAAEAHAAAGEWAEAVRERLRAVVRSLEERTLLEPRPGRTADEAATEAGRVLPDCAAGLREAARLFDDIWYGGRPGSEQAYRTVRALDDRVQAGRPMLQATP